MNNETILVFILITDPYQNMTERLAKPASFKCMIYMESECFHDEVAVLVENALVSSHLGHCIIASIMGNPMDLNLLIYIRR